MDFVQRYLNSIKAIGWKEWLLRRKDAAIQALTFDGGRYLIFAILALCVAGWLAIAFVQPHQPPKGEPSFTKSIRR